ncbi:MAG: hypothetical protein LBV42_02145 [Methanobrevibacter sp.]|nr:hypothetical protein [Methanobrevibacter sp.]
MTEEIAPIVISEICVDLVLRFVLLIINGGFGDNTQIRSKDRLHKSYYYLCSTKISF